MNILYFYKFLKIILSYVSNFDSFLSIMSHEKSNKSKNFKILFINISQKSLYFNKLLIFLGQCFTITFTTSL